MIELVSLIAGTLMTALIALVVFAKNRSSITNQLFIVLATGLVGWSIMTYFSLHASNDMLTLFWIRFVMFFVVIQTTSFLLLASVFPAKRFNLLKSKKHVVAIVYSVITAGVALSPFLFVDFKDGSPVPGPGMALFIPHALVFAVGGLITLIVRYRKAKGVEKAQFQYFLAGTLLIFTLIPLGNFILPIVFKMNQFVVFSPLYSIVFSGLIAYGIVAKRMFDVRLAVARTVTYILLLVTLVSIYSIIVFTFVRFVVGGNQISLLQNVAYIISAVFLAFTYNPLRNFFATITDRIFFQHEYDSQKLLDRFGEITVDEINLRSLATKSMNLLADALKPEFIVSYVIPAAREFSPYRFSVGRAPAKVDREVQETIFNAAARIKDEIIIADELEEKQDKLHEAIMAMDTALIIRLETSHELVGYLFFGSKQNGSIYDAEDVQILRVVASELALAVQNSLRFQEIQEFNETLQNKVSEATAELKESNKKLHALDIAKDEFISMASHQLRTPLTTVKGYLSMVIEGDAGELQPKQRKLLEQAYEGSQRMVYLIGDFLNVSRLQTGKFVLELGKVNLAKLVADEVEQLQLSAKSRQLKIVYEQPEEFPLLRIDETKIRQVIMNFIDNAIFYSKPNNDIIIELLATEKEVTLRVRDKGIGVPADERHHLFTKFYRASNARKVRPDGTGIGIFMAKKVILAHGGSIIFETVEGKGSTFGFTLPR